MLDYLVYIGRFQPFHKGHAAVLNQALQKAKKVIVLIGSAHTPRSTRNPFTFDERKGFIEASLHSEARENVIISPLEDIVYNDTLWVKSVYETVLNGINRDRGKREPTIGLIGHAKDDSSFYLTLFPNWELVEVDNYEDISGTNIRESLYTGNPAYQIDVPSPVCAALEAFTKLPTFKVLKDEAKYIRDYKKSWESAPFPPTFVTVDAVVICENHVLLVERGDLPGKGLWALPGGFINPHETLIDACVRELREETRLKVAEPVIRGSLKTQKTYDDPNRSERGRTITTAFRFDIRYVGSGLPKVKGGDDAANAFWLPLYLVERDKMFEDHFSILQDMLSQNP